MSLTLIILAFVVGMAMPGTAHAFAVVWVEIKTLVRYRWIARAMRRRSSNGFYRI